MPDTLPGCAEFEPFSMIVSPALQAATRPAESRMKMPANYAKGTIRYMLFLVLRSLLCNACVVLRLQCITRYSFSSIMS